MDENYKGDLNLKSLQLTRNDALKTQNCVTMDTLSPVAYRATVCFLLVQLRRAMENKACEARIKLSFLRIQLFDDGTQNTLQTVILKLFH